MPLQLLSAHKAMTKNRLPNFQLSTFNFQFSTHNAMLVKIYPENPNLREIDKVVNIMRDGGLVIYPTDTVYAIGCDALNVRAVE